jgi:YesN/AraC family two-component response regulator
MSRYLLVGLLVLIGCIPFAWMAYKHIRNYIINQNVTKLESGITELENNIEKMRMISYMISDDQNLRMLKQIEGEIPAASVLHLKYLTSQMFDIQYIYDFSPMFFVLFHNNDAFVSTSQVSDSFTEYYEKFLKVDDMSAEEFKNMVFDRERTSSFLYVRQLKYHLTNKEVNAKNSILYIEPIEIADSVNTNKAVMVYVIDEKKIVETLLTKESLRQGMVRITESGRNVIVNYGKNSDILIQAKGQEYIKNDKDTLKILNYNNINKGLEVTVGFPMALVNNQMKDIFQLLLIYAGIGIFIALAISTVFSIHWYGPFSNMLKEAARLENGHGGKINEFDYVRESLLKLVSAKDELETKMLLADAQKQAIRLENILIKGFYKREEEEEFLKSFPALREGYYVAYLQVPSMEEGDKKETPLMSAIEFLERSFEEGFIHVHSMAKTEILLIPAAKELNEERLKDIFTAMSDSVTKQYQTLCLVGISQKEQEICNINVAFANARQTVHAYKNMNTSFVEYYQYIYDQEIGCFHMVFLNKLYDLILCGAKNEINKIFEEVRVECLEHKERYEFHKAEIFYAITFVKYAVYQQLSFIPKEDIRLPKYQQNHSLIQCIDILEASIYEICDKIEDNKRSKKVELRDKIVQYLEDNFQRVELTAEIVSKEIGISEKYLSVFLKDHIGKTFSIYLEELRIQYAKYSLVNTDKSNEIIAKEAGFGAANSFYRVFKKYVGVSPSIYKKSKL